MATSYHRNCVKCGRRIQMRRMPAGHWLPFEGYDMVHVCGAGASIDSQRPEHYSNATTNPTSRTNSAAGYDTLEFVDFNLPGQSETQSSKESKPSTPPRRKEKRISTSAPRSRPGDLGTRFNPPQSEVAAIQRPQINQAVAGSKWKAVLVVLLVALALTAMYLLLSRRSHLPRFSNKAASSLDEAAPAADISANEPKSLTSAEYFEQGIAMTKARKYEAAAVAYQQAIRRDPDMAQAHHELGYAYTQLRQWDKAVASLKQATALKPDLADSHRLLGDALTQLGQWEEALASYNRAITVKPESAATYLGLAAVYKHTKQLPDAVNAYLKVIELRPNHAAARYELGLLYLELDDSDSAQAEYETLLPLNSKLAEKLKQAISRY